ncbi:protein kinase, ATP binding site-containing protein [Tanacetum coccineum]
MFDNELEIVSRFHHENIIPFIGYSDEGTDKILFYEHAINGSLCDHLQDQDKLRCIPHVRSEYILLDENMEAKISEFGLSKFVERTDKFSEEPDLIRRVYRHYGENEMDKLIDPNKRDQTDGRSLQTFVETAYRCLSCNINERLSMNRIIKKIEEALYFQVDLVRYTKDEFLNTLKNHEVAIKRLDKTGHQGKEFLNELKLIFKFHHQNIIPFIGYCDEGDKMILAYEYATTGSLDYHQEDKNKRRCLTWVKCLTICLGAAKGLEYLHTGLWEDNRVIHIVGCGILPPDLDVDSVGVVMFEMLSGMLAWYRRKVRDDKPRPLIDMVRRYYDYGKELLMDPEIKDQIDNSSFQTFLETVYQCISFNSKNALQWKQLLIRLRKH